MVHITFKGIKMVHTCVCLCAAFGFALWGIHLYLLDEDLTRIDVKQYNSGEESVYPSISFFFHSPIPNPEKLRKYDHEITPIMYKRFLQGEIWNDTYVAINYSDVTIDIMDYFLDYTVQYVDFDHFSFKANCNSKDCEWKAPYSHGNTSIGKAFTIDIPYQPHKKVKSLTIDLRNDIFPNQIRPKQISPFDGFNGFGVYFHYPGQLWREKHFRKVTWPLRTENMTKKYHMEFELQNLEIMQNRDKSREPCIDGILDLDRKHFEGISRVLPCRPPYIMQANELVPCRSQEEMLECHFLLLDHLEKLKYPPCRSVKKMDIHYLELDLPQRERSSITMRATFIDQTYTEIVRVKAFDMNALIGNIGGYIGIFVGYSLIMMIPDWIMKLIKCFRNHQEKSYLVLSVYTQKYEKRCNYKRKAVNINKLRQKVERKQHKKNISETIWFV